MSRDHAYVLMRSALKAVLPSVETFARNAKSAPAKKNLMMQLLQIKEALKAAEEAGPPLPRLKDRASDIAAAQLAIDSEVKHG
jgi:hypothetical protein